MYKKSMYVCKTNQVPQIGILKSLKHKNSNNIKYKTE